jgi:hypothetical protein
MSAGLNNPPIIENSNFACIPDCAQPVGDNNYRLSPEKL